MVGPVLPLTVSVVGIVEDGLWHMHVEEEAVLSSGWIRLNWAKSCEDLLQLDLCCCEVEFRRITSDKPCRELCRNILPRRVPLRAEHWNATIFDLRAPALRRDRGCKSKLSYRRLGVAYVGELVIPGRGLQGSAVE